jgi:YHS domain-containing protein
MTRLLLYLLNLVFVIIIGWILNRIVRRLFGALGVHVRGPRVGSGTGNRTRVVRGETARDPVCGMFVSTELSHRLTRGKETLHFCSRECLERYEKNEPQS